MDRSIYFVEIDDETFEVQVGNKYITSVNHDEHGWAGIDLVRETIEGIAQALQVEVCNVTPDEAPKVQD